jgi:hypothetical protein
MGRSAALTLSEAADVCVAKCYRRDVDEPRVAVAAGVLAQLPPGYLGSLLLPAAQLVLALFASSQATAW